MRILVLSIAFDKMRIVCHGLPKDIDHTQEVKDSIVSRAKQ